MDGKGDARLFPMQASSGIGADQAASSHLTSDEIDEVLKRHRYRPTQPRRAVIAAMLSRDRSFTAEEIVTDVAAAVPRLARATVYRTLEILASLDILTRVFHADGQPSYVIGVPGHRHHLLCSECGTAVAFTSCPVDSLVADLSIATDFAIEGHLLQVFGRCPACQATQ